MSAMERWPNETITEFWVRQIMAEARAPLEAEIATLRDALDGLVKAAEGSLVASGGHMDSGWNDVIGATQSWHDCLPNASALRAALAKAKGDAMIPTTGATCRHESSNITRLYRQEAETGEWTEETVAFACCACHEQFWPCCTQDAHEAIEAEAVAAERARIASVIRALEPCCNDAAVTLPDRRILQAMCQCGAYVRDAVLAIINPELTP